MFFHSLIAVKISTSFVKTCCDLFFAAEAMAKSAHRRNGFTIFSNQIVLGSEGCPLDTLSLTSLSYSKRSGFSGSNASANLMLDSVYS